MEGKMKGRKRTLRKGLSGKILSFTMALAMVANLMGGYCAATELSTKEVKAADAEQPPYRNVMLCIMVTGQFIQDKRILHLTRLMVA